MQINTAYVRKKYGYLLGEESLILESGRHPDCDCVPVEARGQFLQCVQDASTAVNANLSTYMGNEIIHGVS